MTTKSKAQQEKHKMSEIDESISKMFDIKKRLGKGAYGIVWKGLDKRTNETVAVKKIFDAFRDETDAQRTFREIIFLKAFRNHPNVIKLLTVYRAANNLDIYLIFEYMESDLHNIIKKGTILKDIHKRYVMYQLINAIKYIHSGNVIHRDLKPSNVLIDSKCRCKLADFGLARSVSNRPMRDNNDMSSDPVIEPILTDYVATRWYRAPEILVASKRYTKGIDMWSLGCILGEMIRGKPLFQGSSTVNQIEKIITALPEITEHDINAVGAGFGSVLLNKQISRERKTSLDEMLCEAPNDAVNMVKSLLVLDPLARLTAKQALGHSYVEKFRNSIPEIELNVDILPPFRDDIRLTVPEYRSKLYEIVHNNINEKGDKRTTGTKGANTKQKEHKHQTPYDKADAIKKSHKSKQYCNSNSNNTSNEEKYISKEKYLSRPEKHESETQPSVSVPSISAKPTRKSSTLSPTVKRKSNKSKYFFQQQQQQQHQHIDERIPAPALRTKNHSRSCEPPNLEHLPAHAPDKRHSIDGGYGSLPDAGLASLAKPLTSPNGQLRKVDSTRRQYRSTSSLRRGEQVIAQANNNNPHQHQHPAHHPTQHAHAHQQQHQYHQSRDRTSTSTTQMAGQEQSHQRHHQQTHNASTYAPAERELGDVQLEAHERYNHAATALGNKSSYIRSTKSDLLNNGGGNNGGAVPSKSNERICYEKRLKKLEEEIEKYKKEVKSFCKDTFNYAHQDAAPSHGHSRAHQQQQQQQQQQTQHYVQQQQQQLRLKSSSSNTKTLQQQQQQQPPSLPTMSSNAATTSGAVGTPKRNHYYEMLTKASRDYGSRNAGGGISVNVSVANANASNGVGGGGGGGGDGDVGDVSNFVFNSNKYKEHKHQQHHQQQQQHNHSYNSHHPQSHHHSQQQQQQQQQHHSHHTQQHQSQQQHHHHQQASAQRIASRPRSKFLSRPQLGEHIHAKTSIANYQ